MYVEQMLNYIKFKIADNFARYPLLTHSILTLICTTCNIKRRATRKSDSDMRARISECTSSSRKLIVTISLLAHGYCIPYPQVARMRQVVSFTTTVLSRLGSPPSLSVRPPLSSSPLTGHHPPSSSRPHPPPGSPLYGSVAPITPAAAKCDPLRVMECANYNIC